MTVKQERLDFSATEFLSDIYCVGLYVRDKEQYNWLFLRLALWNMQIYFL